MTIEHEWGHGSVCSLDPIVQTTLGKHRCRATTLDDFDDKRKAAVVNGLMKKALDNIERDKSHLVSYNIFIYNNYFLLQIRRIVLLRHGTSCAWAIK